MKQFKDLEINGPDEQLNGLLDAFLTKLPAGWNRDTQAEDRGSIFGFTDWVACYAFTRDAKASDPKVGLTLVHEHNRLNVPNIVPLDPGDLSIDQYNRILDEFKNILCRHLPTDSELRLHTTSEEAAITDWISNQAADLLDQFSSLANKSTGAGHPKDFERWARFLIRTHKDDADLDSDFLLQWLVEKLEWPEDRAERLSRDYEFARNLLKIYDDESA